MVEDGGGNWKGEGRGGGGGLSVVVGWLGGEGGEDVWVGGCGKGKGMSGAYRREKP